MPPSVPAGVLDAPLEFRDPLDYSGTRTAVFGAVKDSFKSAFPIDNGTHRLEVADVDYVDPDWFSPADEKKAILERKSLTRRLRGTVSLVDNATGEVIDKAKKTLLHVPYLTDRGTYIKNGSDYTVASQMRLLSGIYARTKDNGEREAHFNVLSGGPPFRVSMDSDTGVYRMYLGGSKLKLYPILRAAGLEDDAIKEKWGRELFEINRAASDGDTSVKKAMAKLASRKEIEENKIPTLPEMLARIKLDSRVTKRTMDKPYETAEPAAILSATEKILRMSKGEAEDDDRDAMAFQETYGPEDLFAERVQKDAGRVAKKLLIKAAAQRSLKSLGSGALDSYMDQVFYRSGMGAALEEINPLDAADQNMRLLRIGEGAIENEDAIPAAARAVQPSQFLYVDPIRAPESLKIGVDTRMTLGVRRGSDKRMYTPVVNVKTGKTEMRNPDELADLAVVFPQEMEQAQRDGRKRVIAIRGGKTVYVKPEEADYIAPSVSNMFTANSLLIPAMGSIKGGRLLMAAKYLNQALPLENPEAPLVLSKSDDGSPYEDKLSGLVGAHRSKEPGRVVEVGNGVVRVQGPSGVKTYTYYENFPHNRKSRLHSTPMVAVGDTVAAGTPLTRSNYTDQAGRIAMGKNLRIAFLVEPNSNYEDGLAISESAAKKLRSEHLYTEALDQDRQTQVDGAKFLGLFPGAFKKEQLALLGKEGVVKVGQTVNYGDPLVLSVSRRDPKGLGMMSRSAKAAFSDSSVKWTHSDPGIVTDVYRDKDGVKVAVLSLADTKVGDKLVNRYAAKGVISAIIPDSQMPVGEDGKPYDMVQNPTGVLTRINPAQATAELLLSKIAAKTGKPYVLEPMMDDNLVSYVKEELRKNRMTPDEEVWDPQTKRKMRLLTGTMHMTKLHHTAESKMSGRSVGSYTMDGEPARGMGQEDSKPKRMGFGEMAALISHGAVNTIRDARVIRGQRNDEYFRQLLQGNRPPDPGMPNSYKKFRAMLASAGIRVRKENDGAERLMAMTDKDVEAISAGEITKPDTVKWTTSFDRTAMGAKDLDPVAGGLFDRGITGGHGGNRFAHLVLSEPFPQPVMEPTIKTLLGLTGPEFDSIVSGEAPIGKFGTGGAGIKAALSAINVDRELNLQKEMFRSQQGPKRDLAAKKIRALTALKDTGVKPGDLVVTKIPVLPPIFRPVSSTAKFDLVSGTNQLYQYLMHSDSNMKELKAVGGPPETEARATTYKMLRALVGLDAPPMKRLQEQNVRGILADITGTSPKFGTFQKKLLGATVDMSGRGAISGDAAMGMDEIGVPETIAWDVFMPYTVGRMVREFGGDAEAKARAMREYADKTERAKAAMMSEMEDRPVLSSRAPALHRYSIMAFKPRLVAGDSIRMSPYTVTGFGADYDGNCVDYDSEISLYISKSSPKVETAQFRAFKESIMLANGKVQVLVDGAISAIVKIGDMPRLGDPVKDKNGADVYEVPKGVFVLSYDQERGEHVYSPVRHLTVENDCQTVTVATKRYEVIVSDNESLAVFDPATGLVNKRAPKDSLRMFCPAVQSDTVFGTSYDFETGWLYGALISDGWVVRGRQVGYSKNDKGLRERVVDIMRRKISPNFTVNEYITEKGQPGKFGKSAKIHMNGKDVVQGLLPFVAPDPGDGKRSALRKFIPKELLLGGSKEALWGLLSGLMDGDSTFSVSKKAGNSKTNNYCIYLLTSSPELRDDMRWLLMKLGIRAATGVTKFKDTRSDAYTLTLSAVDIYNARNDIRLYGKKGAEGLHALVERADAVPLRDNTDIIPLSLAEAEAVRPWLSPQDRGEVRNNMVATRAWLAEKLAAASEDPELASLFTRIRSTEVRWERVVSVEDAGKRQVFDLEVLGTKVFVVNAGLVIWDTMNIYAPASPSAVREAYEKLLPSKNLISPADFGPVIMPRQEYLEGLWRASAKKPKDHAVAYFNTTADLQKAFANGEVDLDDPVRVLDLKTS